MPELSQLDHLYMIELMNEALSEHHSIVGTGRTPVSVEGFYVVGSVLTGDFDPKTSDVDIYVQLSEEYEYAESYSAILSDSTSMWNQQLMNLIPVDCTAIDVIDCVVDDSSIRNPHKYYSQ